MPKHRGRTRGLVERLKARLRRGQPSSNHSSSISNPENDERLLKVPLRSTDDSHEDDDITLFFRQKLKDIRNDRSKRSKKNLNWDKTWSSEETIQKLVYQSNGLFIFAATAYRFLAQRQTNLGDRLEIIMGSGNDEIDWKSPQGVLDALYLDILEAEIRRDATKLEQSKRVAQFQHIIGSIIILSGSLSVHGLSGLLSDQPEDMKFGIEEVMRRMLSVMTYSDDDESIELLHLSFRDFLVNKERAREFWIDEKDRHTQIFERCLELMSQTLEKDVCHLGRVGTRVEDIDSSKIERHLPEYIRYACSYWAYHFQRSNAALSDGGTLHDLLKKHFTHWIEAMAIMKKLPSAILALSDLLTYTSRHSNQCSELNMFVNDARRFLINSRSVIEQAPLQIYASSLLFAPKNSIIRAYFEDEIPYWIIERPIIADDWSPLLQVLKLGDGRPYSKTSHLVFSSDQRLLASTIRSLDVRSLDGKIMIDIWDTETWTRVQSFKLEDARALGITFSPDGKLFAYTDGYGVQVWHLETRKSKYLWDDKQNDGQNDGQDDGQDDDQDSHQDIDEGDPWDICDVEIQFSSDGKRLVMVAGYGNAQIWDLHTGGTLLNIRHGLCGSIETWGFLPDGRLLLLGSKYSETSFENRLQLWDAVEGVILHTFKRPIRKSASFDLDGNLRFITRDGVVQIWDPQTETMQVGINVGRTKIASFSPYDKSLLTISEYGQVHLWNPTSTTSCISLDHVELGNLNYVHIDWLPPTGSYVTVHSSMLCCGWIWEARTGKLQDELDSDIAANSPDGSLIATVSSGSLLHIYDFRSRISLDFRNSSQSEVSMAHYFSPDGTFAIHTDNGIMRVWDMETKRNVQTFPLPDYSFISSVDFSHDGTRVLTVTSSDLVTVWDVDSWSSMQLFTRSAYEGYGVIDFSIPEITLDAGLIAVGLERETWSIEIRDITASTLLQTIGCETRPTNLAISPDGRLVAANLSHLLGARIWSVKTGEIVKMFQKYRSLTFSPNGASIMLLNHESIQVWCTNTWNRLAECRWNELGLDNCLWLRELKFSRDGQWLCTEKGYIRVASILEPSLGPTGKEITYDHAQGSIAEGGKELIMIPHSNIPNRVFFPDPSVAHFKSVLVYKDRPVSSIRFDDLEDRTVRGC